MTSSLQIGLIAYQATPNLVFVRIPNEKGRWMLTDRCVAEVDCSYCGSVAGEPCKNRGSYWDGSPLRYRAGTHSARRDGARKKLGWGYRSAGAKPKLRLRPEDIEAAQSIVGDEGQ
ncbi:zinc finger domain-containing protein [Solimonas marina]|uniref:DNA-binding phage zinc finger domain-containing protein n=1 Tax=Solimonas marina TaxID=2714601 RepID=A0A970B8M3_9GAMM|nr:hypothetical protein [Solimonas marina]NKF21531.1 hypothetical protein [Solimonas marina]